MVVAVRWRGLPRTVSEPFPQLRVGLTTAASGLVELEVFLTIRPVTCSLAHHHTCHKCCEPKNL